MKQYSIRDLERLTGVKAHTIRTWEKRHKIVEPLRTDTNIRCYSDKDLKKLMSVSSLTRNGYRISEIAPLTDSEREALVLSLGSTTNDDGLFINDFTQAMLDVDKEHFEKILNDIILKYTFEEAMMRVIFPFFENANYLWQSNRLRSAQQHFAISIVRQFIIVAIHGQVPNIQHGKTFVLFLPEGEFNELYLLFIHFILKKRNHRVIYLGTDTSNDDLVSICKLVNPDYLLTYSNTITHSDEARLFLRSLTNYVDNVPILASGRELSLLYSDLPETVQIYRTIYELKGILDAM